MKLFKHIALVVGFVFGNVLVAGDMGQGPMSYEELDELARVLFPDFSDEQREATIKQTLELDAELAQLSPEERALEEQKMVEQLNQLVGTDIPPEAAAPMPKAPMAKKEVKKAEEVAVPATEREALKQSLNRLAAALELFASKTASLVVKAGAGDPIAPAEWYELLSELADAIVYLRLAANNKSVLEALLSADNNQVRTQVDQFVAAIVSKVNAIEVPDTMGLRIGSDEDLHDALVKQRAFVDSVNTLRKYLVLDKFNWGIKRIIEKIAPKELKKAMAEREFRAPSPGIFPTPPGGPGYGGAAPRGPGYAGPGYYPSPSRMGGGAAGGFPGISTKAPDAKPAQGRPGKSGKKPSGKEDDKKSQEEKDKKAKRRKAEQESQAGSLEKGWNKLSDVVSEVESLLSEMKLDSKRLERVVAAPLVEPTMRNAAVTLESKCRDLEKAANDFAALLAKAPAAQRTAYRNQYHSLLKGKKSIANFLNAATSILTQDLLGSLPRASAGVAEPTVEEIKAQVVRKLAQAASYILRAAKALDQLDVAPAGAPDLLAPSTADVKRSVAQLTPEERTRRAGEIAKEIPEVVDEVASLTEEVFRLAESPALISGITNELTTPDTDAALLPLVKALDMNLWKLKGARAQYQALGKELLEIDPKASLPESLMAKLEKAREMRRVVENALLPAIDQGRLFAYVSDCRSGFVGEDKCQMIAHIESINSAIRTEKDRLEAAAKVDVSSADEHGLELLEDIAHDKAEAAVVTEQMSPTEILAAFQDDAGLMLGLLGSLDEASKELVASAGTVVSAREKVDVSAVTGHAQQVIQLIETINVLFGERLYAYMGALEQVAKAMTVEASKKDSLASGSLHQSIEIIDKVLQQMNEDIRALGSSYEAILKRLLNIDAMKSGSYSFEQVLAAAKAGNPYPVVIREKGAPTVKVKSGTGSLVPEQEVVTPEVTRTIQVFPNVNLIGLEALAAVVSSAKQSLDLWVERRAKTVAPSVKPTAKKTVGRLEGLEESEKNLESVIQAQKKAAQSMEELEKEVSLSFKVLAGLENKKKEAAATESEAIKKSLERVTELAQSVNSFLSSEPVKDLRDDTKVVDGSGFRESELYRGLSGAEKERLARFGKTVNTIDGLVAKLTVLKQEMSDWEDEMPLEKAANQNLVDQARTAFAKMPIGTGVLVSLKLAREDEQAIGKATANLSQAITESFARLAKEEKDGFEVSRQGTESIMDAASRAAGLIAEIQQLVDEPRMDALQRKVVALEKSAKVSPLSEAQSQRLTKLKTVDDLIRKRYIGYLNALIDLQEAYGDIPSAGSDDVANEDLINDIDVLYSSKIAPVVKKNQALMSQIRAARAGLKQKEADSEESDSDSDDDEE